MKAALLLIAAAVVVSVSAGASDESGYDDYRPTTLEPCPDVCTRELNPVCARDHAGKLYKFSNKCVMRQCSCKMWMRQVELWRCPKDAPGCPLKEGRPVFVGGGAGVGGPASASASSEEDSNSSD